MVWILIILFTLFIGMIETVKDYREYNEVVSKSIEKLSSSCRMELETNVYKEVRLR